MNRFNFFGPLLLFVLAGTTGSMAAPLYDNGPPGQITGFEMTRWIDADDFTLSSAAVVANIKFWNVQRGSDFQSSIVWQIYSNSPNNTPGALLYSGTSLNLAHVATGGNAFGFPEFVNTFDIVPVSLQPGVYWLALHNGPLTNNTDQLVFWEATRQIGPTASQSDIAPFSGSWETNVFSPRVKTFALNNGVPQITFPTISSQNYRVVYKNSLADSLWTPLPGAEMIVGTGAALTVNDPDPNVAGLPRRFYRIETASDLAFQLTGE